MRHVMLRWLLLAAVFLALEAPARAQLVPLRAQPTAADWRAADWAEPKLALDVDRAALEQALDEALPAVHPDMGETRAVAIVQDGQLALERYGPGYARDTKLISWSVAKSITQALVGAAVLQGRVDPDAPMGHPSWAADDPRAQLAWRTWLNMVDGQPWSEMQARGVLDNDSARMLFGEGRGDTAAFGASRRLIRAPGTHWNYNSGGIALVADALTRRIVTDPKDALDRRNRMRAWMDAALFAPIGMHPVVGALAVCSGPTVWHARVLLEAGRPRARAVLGPRRVRSDDETSRGRPLQDPLA